MISLSLFFFASWDTLYFFLFNQKTLLVQDKKSLQLNFVEVFFATLSKILKKQNFSLLDVKNVYTGIGPGSFTTYRAIVVFLKTLQILNTRVHIFTIDNLLFQAGLEKKVISICKLTRQKVYLQTFNAGQKLFSPQLLTNKQLIAFLEKNNTFTNYQNFVGFDH